MADRKSKRNTIVNSISAQLEVESILKQGRMIDPKVAANCQIQAYVEI